MSRRCLICANINPCREHSDDAQRAELARNDAAIGRIRAEENRKAHEPLAFTAPEAFDNAPTPDAYMRACRALHWRTAELRAHGIEPIAMPADAAHFPPEGFDFGASGKQSDHEIAIGEHAFKAGYDTAAQRAVDFAPTVVRDWVTHREASWSEYTPPDDLCGG